MTDRQSKSGENRRQRSAKSRRRSRVIGAGSAVGAFLAFGLSPLAGAPAHADLDDLFDIISADLFGTAADDISFFSGDDTMDVFDDLLADVEGWLDDTSNADLIDQINQPWVELFGRSLIGDGIDGYTGTNDAMLSWMGLGDLGDGGLLFGDGGTGAAGLAGGDAGMFGFGGAGGQGVDASMGDDGSVKIGSACWRAARV